MEQSGVGSLVPKEGCCIEQRKATIAAFSELKLGVYTEVGTKPKTKIF